MKHRVGVASCFVLASTLAFAGDPAVKTIAFDDVHISVADPAKAGAWYVQHLGALPTKSAHRVSFGRTLIIFRKVENAPPSTVIDHIGLSYADLDKKMKELAAAGAKTVTPLEDRPGLFKLGFIEDPWGVKIEVVQDPELLGFHHVHLRVANPEATLKWYEEMFGGKRSKLKGRLDGLLYSTIPDGFAGLGTGAKSHGGVWLLAASNRGETLAPSDNRVIWDLAFQVQDIKQAAEALRSKGVTIVTEPRVTKVEGLDTGVAFARDPDGVFIELLQRSKE